MLGTSREGSCRRDVRTAFLLSILLLAFSDAPGIEVSSAAVAVSAERLPAPSTLPVAPNPIAATRAETATHPLTPERPAYAERLVLRRRISRPAMIRVDSARVVGGLSRRRFQALIQRSIRPRVRDCFARARAGNPHWFGRAVLILTVQGGSVVRAGVETESDSLRACILEGVDYLHIPAVEDAAENARTVAYFPFVSPSFQSLPTPPLEAATSALLDAVFHEEASASPLALLNTESTP